MRLYKLESVLATGLLALTVMGCSSGGSNDAVETEPVATSSPDPVTPSQTAPFQELYDQGIDRYLGVFAPMLVDFSDGGVTTYTFDGSANGPMCFTGETFRMSTRDGTSSELMIFLQGGGACSSANCDAVETAPAGVPPIGLLGAATPGNPAAAYNVGYLPYCDGSLWMGDQATDSDADGMDDRFFRGVQNLSASLDVIVGAYPSPSKILLTGNSAGGYGTHIALPLVRKLYPDVPIELVNDSGVGISQPGAQDAINAQWNATAFFPASCETCIGDDGHLTDYHKYQLAEDPNLRMGFISSKQDEVIADERLMIGGPAYEAALREAMAELNEDFPERFGSLIAEGNSHTFILRDFDRPIGGTTVKQWISDMLRETDNWVSLSD